MFVITYKLYNIFGINWESARLSSETEEKTIHIIQDLLTNKTGSKPTILTYDYEKNYFYKIDEYGMNEKTPIICDIKVRDAKSNNELTNKYILEALALCEKTELNKKETACKIFDEAKENIEKLKEKYAN